MSPPRHWLTVHVPRPQCWVFRTWREYFSYSYLFEEALDHNKRYVFAQ